MDICVSVCVCVRSDRKMPLTLTEEGDKYEEDEGQMEQERESK